jgi:hypothetical protein
MVIRSRFAGERPAGTTAQDDHRFVITPASASARPLPQRRTSRTEPPNGPGQSAAIIFLLNASSVPVTRRGRLPARVGMGR